MGARKTSDMHNRKYDNSTIRPIQKKFIIELISHGYHHEKEEMYIVEAYIKKLNNKSLTKNIRFLKIQKYVDKLRTHMLMTEPDVVLKDDKAIIDKLYVNAKREVEFIVNRYYRIVDGKQRLNKYKKHYIESD